MLSTKPYMLRAIYEWCVDQGFTPYIAVSVDERTVVPREYVRDEQIVLNIGPDAAHNLVMGNDLISLDARFAGVARDLAVPVDRVSAIYAKENGHGVAFEVGVPVTEVGPVEGGSAEGDSAAGPGEPTEGRPQSRPHLVRIK